MSHYSEYMRERLGREIIDTEAGFVAWEIHGDICYIVDIFVQKHKRRSGAATEMADLVSRIAREKGCKKLLGSCVPSTNGSTESLKAMLAYGFRLQSAQENFLWLEKDL